MRARDECMASQLTYKLPVKPLKRIQIGWIKLYLYVFK